MSAESDGLEEIALVEFFGENGEKFSESHFISEYEHRKTQYAWKEFFESRGYKFEKHVNFGYMDVSPPVMTDMEISDGVFMKIYKSATIFFTKGEEKLAIRIHRSQESYSYSIHSSLETNSIFRDLEKFSNEKNLYRGKKINCDCGFLKLQEITWDDVILPTELINVIRANVDELFTLRDRLKKYGLSVKRGLILHGDPGTGKTNVCRCLAKDSSFSVLYALPTDFSPQRGGVRRICKMAQDLAPCLLIIEDIDWIAQDRAVGNASFVMELMNQLDGIESFGDIITVGTTNALSTLEDAVKNRPGRFDRLIKVGKPDEDCRTRMIYTFTRNYVLSKDVDVKLLASVLDGLTGAHIRDLCITAALYAVKSNSTEGEKLLLEKVHFESAVKEVKDKDYSSYMKLQGSKAAFGFNAEQSPGISDFLDEGML